MHLLLPPQNFKDNNENANEKPLTCLKIIQTPQWSQNNAKQKECALIKNQNLEWENLRYSEEDFTLNQQKDIQTN